MAKEETSAVADAPAPNGSSGETVEQVIDRLLPKDDADEAPFTAEAAEGKRGKKSKARREEPEPDEDDEEGSDEQAIADLEDDAEVQDDEDLEDEESDDDELEEDEEDDDGDMALHRAYTLLHEEGVPASVLKNTPKAKLISWAESVEEKRAKTPKGSADSPEQERDAEDEAAEPSRSPARGEKQSRDWNAVKSAIADKLGVDDDAVESLKPIFDQEDLRAELKELRERLERRETESREREGRETVSREMRRLVDSGYPDLKANKRKRERVTEAAATLITGLRERGKSIDVEAVFNKAALLELGKPKRKDLASLRRNGFATAPADTRQGLDSTKTDADYWGRAVDLAVAGRADLIGRLRPPPREKKAKSKAPAWLGRKSQ